MNLTTLLQLCAALNVIPHILCLSQLPNGAFTKPTTKIITEPTNTETPRLSRRSIIQSILIPTFITSLATPEKSTAQGNTETRFKSEAFDLREYTNAVTASRDTNISPFEAYDVIQSSFGNITKTDSMRALDLGAGAGASTELLWKLGYHTIDAVDWSSKAWDKFVTSTPDTVKFYEMDADSFYTSYKPFSNDKKYNAIVFNFAVNENKARKYAREMLVSDGLLLAPVNVQRDYWFKQIYKAYDCNGDIQRVFGGLVGAWDVLFQPDVSETSCQGIWCPPYNGFKK